jgi:hypothetical protein
MWLWNLAFSALFAAGGGIAAYFGWLGRRGQPSRSYDLDETLVFSLISFVLMFLLLSISSRRKSTPRS